MSLEKLLIKDRKCGSCSVCCKSLRIEEPELKNLLECHVSILKHRADVRFITIAHLYVVRGTADGEF